MAAFDAYGDLGSIPNTPSRVEGPERAIVAGGCESGAGQQAQRGLERRRAWRGACLCLARPASLRFAGLLEAWPGGVSRNPPGCQYAVLSSGWPAGFVGELEGELSVEPGDVVKVHSEVDGWARVIRLSDNRTGLVPSWAVGGD